MASMFAGTKAPKKKDFLTSLEEELCAPPPKIDFHARVLFAGAPDTAKTGAALLSLTDEDIKQGKQEIIIDFDLGSAELISLFHQKKYENGNIRNWNPYVWKDAEIDYIATMKKVKGMARLLNQHVEEWKVKTVIVDGISRFLNICEYQMRLDTGLKLNEGSKKESGGQSVWRVRKKYFFDVIDAFLDLPVDVIFIAHQDFLPSLEKDPNAIQIGMDGRASQKFAFRSEEDVHGVTTYYAKMVKSRQNPLNKNKEVEFAQINPQKGEVYKFDATKIFELLKPLEEKK